MRLQRFPDIRLPMDVHAASFFCPVVTPFFPPWPGAHRPLSRRAIITDLCTRCPLLMNASPPADTIPSFFLVLTVFPDHRRVEHRSLPFGLLNVLPLTSYRKSFAETPTDYHSTFAYSFMFGLLPAPCFAISPRPSPCLLEL